MIQLLFFLSIFASTLKNYMRMLNCNLSLIQGCLDDYMLKMGKVEINEIEANNELARNGLMEDDQSRPGRPLREYLSSLRDTNLLPQNIKQFQGLWRIKHSKTVMKVLQILQF